MDTGCEQRLWAQLRDRRLNGIKFVRQLPVGPYISDFACRGAGVIVEVDGATHSTEEEVAHDARRTNCLRANGWAVVRIQNEDVVRRIQDVLDTILMAVAR